MAALNQLTVGVVAAKHVALHAVGLHIEANVVLKDFLVRFSARFGVPGRHPQVA